MQKINMSLLCLFGLALSACATDKHTVSTNPQKIYDAVAAKYPESKSILVFVDTPEGFIAPKLANCAVEEGVDNADVVAIISVLAFKMTTVVIAGDNESLTATTLAQALKAGKDNINGSKAIVIGTKGQQNKNLQKTLADLATLNGVMLEFIDNPS